MRNHFFGPSTPLPFIDNNVGYTLLSTFQNSCHRPHTLASQIIVPRRLIFLAFCSWTRTFSQVTRLIFHKISTQARLFESYLSRGSVGKRARMQNPPRKSWFLEWSVWYKAQTCGPLMICWALKLFLNLQFQHPLVVITKCRDLIYWSTWIMIYEERFHGKIKIPRYLSFLKNSNLCKTIFIKTT